MATSTSGSVFSLCIAVSKAASLWQQLLDTDELRAVSALVDPHRVRGEAGRSSFGG